MPEAPISPTTKTLLPFTKMHGLGNDFILVTKEDLSASPLGQEILAAWGTKGKELAKGLCDRHFSIGADGFILVSPATRPDCAIAWTFLNSDGSPSNMCGNGLRCLALWAHENQKTSESNFSIETVVGAIPVEFKSADSITIDLREPIFEAWRIPFHPAPKNSNFVKETLTIDGAQFTVTCLSMGNPHCVVFEPNISETDYETFALKLQGLKNFPEGVNVEFVRCTNRKKATVKVFERGAGATLACATGAAATLVAGVLEDRLERQATIELPGGELDVEWSEVDNHVKLTGPATIVYSGTIDLSAVTPRCK